METLYAIAFGAMLAASVYLLMARNLLRMVLGLLLLGNAVNLSIFVAGRLASPVAPLVPQGSLALEVSANPLPQALILTAIVISFSLVAFAAVLFERAHAALDTLDPDRMHAAEAAVPVATAEGRG